MEFATRRKRWNMEITVLRYQRMKNYPYQGICISIRKFVSRGKQALKKISGNLTKERDRFEKELSLAPKEKVLLIENANYSDVANGNYNTQYNKKSFLASLHSFWFKYNIPVFFMPDNKYSALFIKKYFEYYLKNYLR